MKLHALPVLNVFKFASRSMSLSTILEVAAVSGMLVVSERYIMLEEAS